MTNANKAKPELYLDLDRRRRVKLNLRGMNLIEQATGRSFFRLINWQELGSRDATYILWAALLADDPTLTFERVEELFDADAVLGNMAALQQFAQEVVERCMPVLTEEDRAKVEEQKKRVRRVTESLTGLASGQLDGLSSA